MSPSLSADSIQVLSRELRRLRLDEYHRVIEAGLFGEDERVELLEGMIVSVSPQNAHHAIGVERLADAAFVHLPPEYVIRCLLPLSLSEADEPEPDVAVLERATPRSRRQQPATARLVFEVAGESLRKDRAVKAALYARAGIPEYVIVNLKEECLEVHRDPDPGSGLYRQVARLLAGETFASAGVVGLRFEVAALLA